MLEKDYLMRHALMSQLGCGCAATQYRACFYIQCSDHFICTLAYKFLYSMGLNDKNAITALQGLKE